MATWAKTDPRSVVSVQSADEDAPTGDVGVNLDSVAGFSLVIECDAGESFSAEGGKLLGYYKGGAGWAKLDESWDRTLPVTAIGQRRFAFPDFAIYAPRGFVAHVTDNVTVTGGNLTLYYECSTLSGERA